MKYTTLRGKAKQFRAITGHSIEEFDVLSPIFEQSWHKWLRQYQLNGKRRTRRYSPKGESVPQDSDELLFFILVYLKNNLLQETLAAAFEMSQDMANKLIHVLIPILEKAYTLYKPTNDPAVAAAAVKAGEYYAIDATEQRVQRDLYDQKQYYSGKKKHIL